MKSDILITRIIARPCEIDPYHIVHHANYYNWTEMCLKEYMMKYMTEWTQQKLYSLQDGVITRFFCKYVYSVCEGMELSIRTSLKSIKEDEFGEHIIFGHFVTDKITNRKIATAESELSFRRKE